jgi:hypothetical protein
MFLNDRPPSKKIHRTGKFEIEGKWSRPDYINEFTETKIVLTSGVFPRRVDTNTKYFERASDGSKAVRISEREFEIVDTGERVLIKL